jgi:hypothetical protein
MTLKEVRTELQRLKYGMTFDNLIINRTGQVTGVLIQIKRERIKFINEKTSNLISSYPARVESIAKFLNTFWYANV